MTIVGIICIVAGVISAIYGISMNNSIEAQLTSLFSSGNANPGTMWIIIGVIAVVIGIVLLIAGRKKN